MSLRVCVDANLAARWILPTEQDKDAELLLEEWDQTGTDLISPPMFEAEVTSTIRKNVYLKRVLPEEEEEAYRHFSELGVRIVSPPELTKKAWQLAQEFNLPVCYDMQYLAVAELEDCEFWTADRKLIASLKGKNKRIRLLGDFKAKKKRR